VWWLSPQTNVKQPGLSNVPTTVEMDLSYGTRFDDAHIPDAYTRLILDVLRGKQSGFVRDDELDAAWAIFTPLLHRIETEEIQPIPYAFGSRGPKEADEMLARGGFQHDPEYQWKDPHAKAAGR
jgi:glucose-6-phosphate 1-dehydrogenase